MKNIASKPSLIKGLAALLLGTVMAASQAQTAAARPAAPPPAQIGINVNALNELSASMLATLDAGQADRLYQAGSAEFKKVQNEKAFTDGVQNVRRPLGVLTARQWQSSSLSYVRQPQAPVGDYMNIVFFTTLSQGQVVRELVTLRLDEDNNWRFMGYSLGNLTAPAAAQ